MHKVYLKPGKEDSLKRFHPWIFSGAIARFDGEPDELGQASSTLSGGENQRVKLAFYLSQEKADPTMFIFDEPTTGLHFHDIRKLLDAFDALIRRGHSIVIIEHNMDVIKCADYVIDLGPEGGDKGGNIVAVGTPEEVAACGASYTGQFLKEKLR